MSFIVLILAIAISLVLIGTILQPVIWVSSIHLPYWIYLSAGFILLAWFLGD